MHRVRMLLSDWSCGEEKQGRVRRWVLQFLVGRQVGPAVKQGSQSCEGSLPGSKRVNQGKKVPESGDRK